MTKIHTKSIPSYTHTDTTIRSEYISLCMSLCGSWNVCAFFGFVLLSIIFCRLFNGFFSFSRRKILKKRNRKFKTLVTITVTHTMKMLRMYFEWMMKKIYVFIFFFSFLHGACTFVPFSFRVCMGVRVYTNTITAIWVDKLSVSVYTKSISKHVAVCYYNNMVLKRHDMCIFHTVHQILVQYLLSTCSNHFMNYITTK